MNERPRRTIAFRGCAVRIWSFDYLETVFLSPDGRELKAPALLTHSPENSTNARALGYGPEISELRRFHVEHEIGHTAFAEAIGLPYSPTLAHVAGLAPATDAAREQEEGQVFAVQRYINTGYCDPVLASVTDRALKLAADTIRRLSKLDM